MDQDPTTENQETTAVAVHEVDSNYTKHDIKLPHEGKRTGLVIGIIVAVLVLIFGGTTLWFCLWYSNPDQVAYDAMNNLFKAENVGFEGGITVMNPNEDDALKMVLIAFDSSSSGLPNATSAKIQFVFNEDKVEGEPRVLIEVKNVVMRDGVIYLQIGGMMDSINSLELDDVTREGMGIFLDTIEVIDNEWWQISIPDLIETMELPAEQSNAMTEVYNCAVQAMNSDMSGEMATIYKQNRFVEVKPSKYLGPEGDSVAPEITSGHKAYELIINKAKLASFANHLPETEAAEEFFACYNQAAKKYGGDTIDVDDIDEIDEDDVEWPDTESVRIFLEISQWDHRLRSAHIYSYDDGEDIGGGMILFKYDQVEVTAPESYRPITDLFDELAEIFSQVFMVPAESYEEM